jgi:hypothetical protein
VTAEVEPQARIGNRAREGIARVLDLLLPGTETLPSGREVGAHDELLDRVLVASPRLLEPVRRLGDIAAEHESFSLDDAQRWAGEQLELAVFALQAAYYMAPVVMQAHNYPGQVRRPIAQATPEEVWSEDLINPVIRRGPIYLPTPPRTQERPQ